jgi:uncharacterized SAM-binding protein YcdF (DUF218 family)
MSERGFLANMKRRVGEIRRDLRAPLPEAEALSPHERRMFRARYLLAKYGWRVLAAAVAFYLVRDLLLYVALPYLVAMKLVG